MPPPLGMLATTQPSKKALPPLVSGVTSSTEMPGWPPKLSCEPEGARERLSRVCKHACE